MEEQNFLESLWTPRQPTKRVHWQEHRREYILLTNVASPQTTYDTEYINKSSRRQPDIGHQISAMMLRFEQLLGITADCNNCSRKYKEKIASSRVNEPIAENTEFGYIGITDTNT